MQTIGPNSITNAPKHKLLIAKNMFNLDLGMPQHTNCLALP